MLDIYALTTVSGVKDYGDISMDDTSITELLENLINRVSALFETYLGIDILEREYTEYIYTNEANQIFPDHTPITSVSGIWTDSDWLWEDEDLIDSTEYIIVDTNRVKLKNSYSDFKIIYTAGYPTTPYELEQACIEEVLHRFKSRTQVDITSKTLEDGTVMFTGRELLPQVKEVLKQYKRKAWV